MNQDIQKLILDVQTLTSEVSRLSSELAETRDSKDALQRKFDDLSQVVYSDRTRLTPMRFAGKVAYSGGSEAKLESGTTASAKVRFAYSGSTAADGVMYEMYQEPGGGQLYIKATYAGTGNIQMYDAALYFDFDDEISLVTGDTQMLLASGSLSFADSTANTFKLHLPNHGSDPSSPSVGDLCVSGGKLKICASAGTWTVVGTQT